MARERSNPPKDFLPDFGSLNTALGFVVLAEMIALIITIGRNAALDDMAWQDFNLLSLLAITISVASAIVLKLANPLLRHTPVALSSVLAVVLLLVVTTVGIDVTIAALFELNLIPERYPPWRESMMVRGLMVAAILGALGVRYFLLQYRINIEARAQQDARMQALQSRIRPHFLFNSLNSVASLTRSNPEKGEAVLHDLADLFRVLLADARKLVPISAEREISRQYLEIEKMRLGDRLSIQWNVSPTIPSSTQIPALTLQPLLENAIYHGIESRFAGGTVKIDMWTEGATLQIMISNPLPDVRKNPHGKGNQLAQENTRQRLTTQFGKTASLQAFEENNQYFVKIKMPIVHG